MGKRIDLTGQRFGRLVVVRRTEDYISPKGKKFPQYVCICDCGKETIAKACHLQYGYKRSCGCFKSNKTAEKNETHGETGSRLYTIWKGMKDRCYRQNSNRFHCYGGRGITVCDEWLNNFNAFRDWALSHGYADDLTIDRIDNNKGYSPENCRWATKKQQARNFSRNHLITYKGQTKPLIVWSEELGIRKRALWYRLFKANWTVEKAFETPVGKPRYK